MTADFQEERFMYIILWKRRGRGEEEGRRKI
jgi:hypothetical protein